MWKALLNKIVERKKGSSMEKENSDAIQLYSFTSFYDNVTFSGGVIKLLFSVVLHLWKGLFYCYHIKIIKKKNFSLSFSVLTVIKGGKNQFYLIGFLWSHKNSFFFLLNFFLLLIFFYWHYWCLFQGIHWTKNLY